MLARLLAALALLLPPAALVTTEPAAAATARRLDLADLVRQADLIVLATVQATAPTRRGNRIITRATLVTETALKGTPPDPLVVEVPGGVIGGIGQKVPGAARFEVGEQVIVFLGASDSPGHHAVIGMAQGKLRVVPGLDGGRLVRDLDGLSLVDVAADGTLDGAGAPTEVPLIHLLSEIARLRADTAGATDGAESPAAPLDPRPDAPTVHP